MTSNDVENRLRQLGSVAPTTLPWGMDEISRSAERRRVRRRAAEAGLAVGLVAVAAVVAVAAYPSAQPQSHRALSHEAHHFAPACPPAGAELDSAVLAAEGISNSTFVARPGDDLTIPLTIANAPSDRQVTRVDLTLVAPSADPAVGSSLREPLTASDEAARGTVQGPGSGVSVTAHVMLPSGIPAGTYNLVAISYWPMPSICGEANPSPSTLPDGYDIEVIGQVTVR